ncbi:P-loop containing nucleoside triphosphate hydrolase protein [Mycena polygramma]|nr:P-loop containing nucleoside triphosphate hydrolase protein [Mycena polygramma]
MSILSVKRRLQRDASPFATEVDHPVNKRSRKNFFAFDAHSTESTHHIHHLLVKSFGLQAFRGQQLDVIKAALLKHDVFVLMPTAGGKSLCYQLPALYEREKFGRTTVVVSPLLSLMRDQVNSLMRHNIDAVMLSAETPGRDADNIRQRLVDGPKPALVYLTPERFQDRGFVRILLQLSSDLARFVVDEAQCVATWGEDFREGYRLFATRLRDDFPDTPIMALTASADRARVTEISQLLNLKNPQLFKQSLNRPNIRYTIQNKTNTHDMFEFITTFHPHQSGIIYCRTTGQCEKIAKKLQDKGIVAKFYHAKMESAERLVVQDDWQSGKYHLIVATIAFGLGIDKPDVRFVIHWDAPKNLDEYYQESGRAGRDGNPAESLLYYSPHDTARMRQKLNNKPTQQAALDALVQYCENRTECRRVQLLRQFGETIGKEMCGQLCDNCLIEGKILTEDVTSEGKQILQLVQILNAMYNRVTTWDCVKICMGSKTARVRDRFDCDTIPGYGTLHHLGARKVKLIFDRLQGERGLEETWIQTGQWQHCYLQVGPLVAEFLHKGRSLHVTYEPKANKTAERLLEDPTEPSGDDHSQGNLNSEHLAELRHDMASELYRRLLSHRSSANNGYALYDTEILQNISLAAVREDHFDEEKFNMIVIAVNEQRGKPSDKAKLEAEAMFRTFGRGFLELCETFNPS